MPNQETDPLDVVVVGGGPAGLSAALWLARYRRSVRVYDTGEGRNAAAWAVHGYPGIADLPPEDLRNRIREQALGAGAEMADGAVARVQGGKDDFRVTGADGGLTRARRILMAFGRTDRLPEIPGLGDAYGTAVFHCPDCDGPSMFGARVGVLGHDPAAARLALYLAHWASETTLLTHGRSAELTDEQHATLRRYGVALREERIERADSRAGRLHELRLEGSPALPLDGFFFSLGSSPACRLAEDLGCEPENAHLRIDDSMETTVPGVFAAGDITGHPHLAISAAADGVRAALSLHRSLLPPDLQL